MSADAPDSWIDVLNARVDERAAYAKRQHDEHIVEAACLAFDGVAAAANYQPAAVLEAARAIEAHLVAAAAWKTVEAVCGANRVERTK